MTEDLPNWMRLDESRASTGWAGDFGHRTTTLKRNLRSLVNQRPGLRLSSLDRLAKALRVLQNYARFSLALYDKNDPNYALLRQHRPEIADIDAADTPETVSAVIFMVQKREIVFSYLLELQERRIAPMAWELEALIVFLTPTKLVNEMEVLAAASRLRGFE